MKSWPLNTITSTIQSINNYSNVKFFLQRISIHCICFGFLGHSELLFDQRRRSEKGRLRGSEGSWSQSWKRQSLWLLELTAHKAVKPVWLVVIGPVEPCSQLRVSSGCYISLAGPLFSLQSALTPNDQNQQAPVPGHKCGLCEPHEYQSQHIRSVKIRHK